MKQSENLYPKIMKRQANADGEEDAVAESSPLVDSAKSIPDGEHLLAIDTSMNEPMIQQTT